ncbi:hypothetical protein B9Z55_019034 [Caenorhabditis nigoni]|uniref:Uncharacterized protein n=1 Tax=Caenorhabditis nigoni TaxID=1611254 RepID=A0A2G5THC9_9PELO|nr:hypothetical protein B9Z55_019034 [Caenorhabditis nigoni]
MGIDANGKPIKRQAPANNKKPGNNQKKGGNNNNNSHHNRTVEQDVCRTTEIEMEHHLQCSVVTNRLANHFVIAFLRNSNILFSGYNGPSANDVGQSAIGANMNPSFGGPAPSAMEVPGKNSNHELFGKMIGRQMEQIQDAAVVDQLQNRMMNLMHDALAEQEATRSNNNNKEDSINNNNNKDRRSPSSPL